MVTGGVQWIEEVMMMDDEVFTVMHGRLYGYERATSEA